jgi:hypothetical protein
MSSSLIKEKITQIFHFISQFPFNFGVCNSVFAIAWRRNGKDLHFCVWIVGYRFFCQLHHFSGCQSNEFPIVFQWNFNMHQTLLCQRNDPGSRRSMCCAQSTQSYIVPCPVILFSSIKRGFRNQKRYFFSVDRALDIQSHDHGKNGLLRAPSPITAYICARSLT